MKIVDALRTAPITTAAVTAALGEVTRAEELRFTGGVSDAPPNAEFSCLVHFERVASEIVRARKSNAEGRTTRLRSLVAHALVANDADAFRRVVGDQPLRRYAMWSTYSDEPGQRPLANAQDSRDAWLRLGLHPHVPMRMAAMWYRLPTTVEAFIPTICNAFAGNAITLNECFQPAPKELQHGRTVRCLDHESTDGFPEVVHSPVTAGQVVAVETREP